MLLSILIPTYNRDCTALVTRLGENIARCNASEIELILVEDGSNEPESVAANARVLADIPTARHLVAKENTGRAAIRNRLAREARGRWLLYLDSGVMPPDNAFIRRYLQAITEAEQKKVAVITGGIRPIQGKEGECLRYRYELSAVRLQSTNFRRRKPYQSFRTPNFCIRREEKLRFPFDETFKGYGYEDVLFGRTLEQHHILVSAIDNAVDYAIYDSDPSFIEKTVQANRSLRAHASEMTAYSGLVRMEMRLSCIGLLPFTRRLLRPLVPKMKERLLARPAPLLYYKVYRLANYLICRTGE